MALTDIGIRNLKPARRRREIPDGNGLYVTVQPSGRRGFCVRYRYLGRPRKLTLPSGLTLAAARRLAAEAMYALAQGIDPAEAKKAAAAKAAAAAANTVAAVCEEYLRREGGKLRTVDQRISILNRLVYPALGDRQIDTVRRSDIVRLLDQVEDGSGPRMADSTLATVRRIFAWHATRSDDFRSPVVRGMGRQDVAAHRRSRILDDDELRRLWRATEADGGPFSALVQFLLLTTARRGEAAAMRWAEVAADVWTLPARRNKAKVLLARPLSKAAQALLAAQPKINEWVFSPTGRGPLASFSEPKAKLDAASGVTNWRLHDLRRTSRSLLSRAGVNADIAERCLGHALPAIRGTYDRHGYINEMRHAFEVLASLVERIVTPPQGDVIPLRGR
jgi:integrase